MNSPKGRTKPSCKGIAPIICSSSLELDRRVGGLVLQAYPSDGDSDPVLRLSIIVTAKDRSRYEYGRF